MNDPEDRLAVRLARNDSRGSTGAVKGLSVSDALDGPGGFPAKMKGRRISGGDLW